MRASSVVHQYHDGKFNVLFNIRYFWWRIVWWFSSIDRPCCMILRHLGEKCRREWCDNSKSHPKTTIIQVIHELKLLTTNASIILHWRISIYCWTSWYVVSQLVTLYRLLLKEDRVSSSVLFHHRGVIALSISIEFFRRSLIVHLTWLKDSE